MRKQRRGLIVAVSVAILATVLSGCSAGTASGGSTGAASKDPAWCGTAKIKMSYADGFSGNTWRQVTKAIYEQAAAQCSNITSAGYTDANLDTQTAISQINSSVSQGVNALLVFPDAGAALLPAVRTAAKQGVVVGTNLGKIPGAAIPGVVSDAILQDNKALGTAYANWMVKALNGKGNVVYLGGTPGNTDSPAQTAQIKAVFAKHPGMHLVTGDWVVANWDQSDSQKAIAGLLGTNEIDGVIGDVDGAFLGTVQALQAAGKPMIPIAAAESNAASCSWQDASGGDGKKFPAMFTSVANISARLLVEAVVAKANKAPTPAGISKSGTTLFERPTYYDTTINKDPKCDTSIPLGASLSTGLSKAELTKLFK